MRRLLESFSFIHVSSFTVATRITVMSVASEMSALGTFAAAVRTSGEKGWLVVVKVTLDKQDEVVAVGH